MSLRLMAQAMSIKVGNPLRKLVLIKLADNANDDGVCFPSYQYVADVCEISKASARTHIEALIQMGFVSKQARKNKDGLSSNLYQLHLDKAMPAASTGMLGASIAMPAASTGGMLGASTITSHSSEPVNKPKKTTQKKSALELLAEFGITGQLAEDFIALRKAKRATITPTVLNGFQREADKAGIPIQQAVEICIERNWQGFKADWDLRGVPNNPDFAKNHPKRTACNAPDPFDKSGDWARGRVIYVREDAL